MLLLLPFLLLAASSPQAAPRDAAYWRGLAESKFAVPEGASPGALLEEASALLASPDPTLRDGVGYAAAAEWIVRKKVVEPADLRRLLALWTRNLKAGLGQAGDDSVLLRSFSALDLSLLAARDLDTPYLQPAELTALLDAALAYLSAERDLRAYDAEKGWIHATAHTADLLKFLARNPRLPRADAARVLPAIGAKLRDAGEVFGWGEDERVASAALAVVRRKDFDPIWLSAWQDGLIAPAEGLWDTPFLDVRRFAAVQNAKHVLARLHVLLSVVPEPPAPVAEARTSVLHALERLP
ncbi:MAG TPA: DUF2785 domain-containing protein [Candidatus Polarisedimenticolaceae bacterium]|nr:DUF2785 domain-containing protein [Candidatus Polarisedimenticolaceae bacterium]